MGAWSLRKNISTNMSIHSTIYIDELLVRAFKNISMILRCFPECQFKVWHISVAQVSILILHLPLSFVISIQVIDVSFTPSSHPQIKYQSYVFFFTITEGTLVLKPQIIDSSHFNYYSHFFNPLVFRNQNKITTVTMKKTHRQLSSVTLSWIFWSSLIGNVTECIHMQTHTHARKW